VAGTIQTVTDDRNRLEAAVTGFSLFSRDLCPEAHLEISFVRYEDEAAHIWISLPATLTADEREELAKRIAERSLDTLLVGSLM
jgi:hypothetical protein